MRSVKRGDPLTSDEVGLSDIDEPPSTGLRLEVVPDRRLSDSRRSGICVRSVYFFDLSGLRMLIYSIFLFKKHRRLFDEKLSDISYLFRRGIHPLFKPFLHQTDAAATDKSIKIVNILFL